MKENISNAETTLKQPGSSSLSDLFDGGRKDDSTNDDEEVFKTDSVKDDFEKADLDNDDFDDEEDLEENEERPSATDTIQTT